MRLVFLPFKGEVPQRGGGGSHILNSRRIIVNTLAQYLRSAINILLSLYSTRIILSALGMEDYGIYAVVAGVVVMLGFLTNALIQTTQRFIAFHHGQGDKTETRRFFVTSLIVHLALGTLMAVIIWLLRSHVMTTWLDIAPERMAEAFNVYDITIGILWITFLISPFKALLIARENIVYISVVEVVDGLLKLGMAFLLYNIDTERLTFYTWLMLGIQGFNLLCFAAYALLRYEECTLLVRRGDVTRQSLRQLLSFSIWTTYGAGVVVGRNQGIAILIENAFGVVMNAAYGIAFQVYGAVAFVASSVLNAMNPQIVKAEGAGDRQEMFHLARQESKYSTLLLVLLCVPICMEMTPILNLWLEEVPPSTATFCRFILFGLICDQLTYGLNTANQAIGNIRNYTLLLYTPKILILVPIFFVLKGGGTPLDIMAIFVATEFVVALIRLAYFHHLYGVSVTEYVRSIFLPILAVIIIQAAAALAVHHTLHSTLTFIIALGVSIAAGLAAAWRLALTKSERAYCRRLCKRC